ncbi:MAG: gas vesicle protein GvpN, partial [Okeania sp. SIO2D1]|nr:gas vesicle protein GvpN [Okeania sp. SIO2D1]
VRTKIGEEKLGGLRSCLIIGKVCHDHNVPVNGQDPHFQDICADILISRASLPRVEAMQRLEEVLKEFFPTEKVSTSNV